MKKINLLLLAILLTAVACFAIEDLDGYYKALEDARYYVGESKMDSADIRIAEMNDFLKAGKYSEETDEYGNYYYALGVRQINSDMEKEAKENLQKCIDIFKKIYGEKNEIMYHVYRNIGKECVFAEKCEAALDYFKSSDEIFSYAGIEMDANYGELKYFQARMSLVIKEPNYAQSLQYAEKAIDAYDYSVDYGYEYCKSYEMAGDTYMALKKYQEAYDSYSHALNAYTEYLGPDGDEFLKLTEKLSEAEKLKDKK
ncbi:TPA: hypothetical protein DCW38_02105 [candidate division WOR-3 bacterium]|uniref:Uncharacterized protein n=1 Tax=candidate division WOR-3 bacterium TaxID=2052148 RepID=A0A350H8U1_UNCW3|nr:hypothetical protein [candidate division WOR-3 bacterium]